MKIWDSHMHSRFSGDSEADPVEMILKAQRIGLPGITFTDHLDWDFQEEPGLFDLDIPKYNEEIHQLMDKYNSQDFNINYGIELGLQTHLANRHHLLLLENNFDYVIGSLHVIDGMDPYYPAYFEGKDPTSAYNHAYECMLENIVAFNEFDSLGHLDYVFRYGPAKELGIDSYDKYKNIVDEILHYIIAHDIALEINTGAFRKGLKEPNPNIQIIKQYKNMGGKLITIGADAHSPEYVGEKFDEMEKLLTDIGFKSYQVFKSRTPIDIPFN
ncbi:MAG: histidinol-phosphatase HisJ family protein [Lachnospiraceae bacterium]|nr:histidinol-phosphatase HisJ family protein [Lachnospiraceae bacterium]